MISQRLCRMDRRSWKQTAADQETAKRQKAEGNSDRAGKISLSQRNHQRSVCADCCYGADVRVGLWQDNSASGDTASATTAAKDQDESSSDSTTAGTTTEKAATTTTEASSDEDLPDIEAQDTVDYTNVLYLKGYETFSADGYSFGYPKAFYKTVSKTSKGYRFESDDKYEWLEYSKEKMSGSQSTASAISSIRRNLKNRLNKENDILYKETGVCIMGGVEKTDEDQAIYYLARIQGNYIYTMEVGYKYPDPSNKTEKIREIIM